MFCQNKEKKSGVQPPLLIRKEKSPFGYTLTFTYASDPSSGSNCWVYLISCLEVIGDLYID